MAVVRWRWAAVAALVATGLTGCGAAAGPEQPTPSGTPTAPASADPSPSVSARSSPSTGPSTSPSAGATRSPAGPSAAQSGPTLRQLGFENGPLDEFSLPPDAVITTSVDQPNGVTFILERPSPQVVEDYLRATLPAQGFAIDPRAHAGQAMRFEGNGWTGGFTGTGATSAIVLRPA